MLGSNEAWLQVTAGQGPAECAWAVVRVVEKIQAEAEAAGLEVRTLDVAPGPKPGTAQSVLLSIRGAEGVADFGARWRGSIQWIARSPFRPEHKRKNWFVGVEILEFPTPARFDLRDVRFETMRASGPGGQHVNRTESAVRITHVPSGLQASASEERSQHRNKALALARLAHKMEELGRQRLGAAERNRWQAHHSLERGNPVRVFREERQ
jgi:peptide chain release factor